MNKDDMFYGKLLLSPLIAFVAAAIIAVGVEFTFWVLRWWSSVLGW